MDAQNDGVNNGPSEGWLCFICFKSVSPERPPTLNLDNCSCSESGTSLNDPGAPNLPLRSIPNEANGDHPELLHKALLSLSIANPPIPTSVSNGQHHPNRLAGTANETNTHISADAEIPYTLRRYVSTMSRLERSYHIWGVDQEDEEQARYEHDIYLIGLGTESTRAVKGAGSSIESSMHSSFGLMSWGMVDPVAGTGGWTDEVEGCETMLRATDRPLVIDDSAFLDDE
jgi:hypothetical protein